MNIKITSKDGLTLKTKGKYCTEDISVSVDESILGGGATITTKGGWQGTAVPNSGTVDKLYLNTNHTNDEVLDLAKKLTYVTDTSGNQIYWFLFTNTNDYSNLVSISFIKDDNLGNEYSLVVNLNYMLWSSTSGWDYEIINALIQEEIGYVQVGLEVFNVLTDSNGSYDVGTQNNLLSSLLSTTPFVQSDSEQVTLEGEYDGSTIEITETSGGGTAVPNSGIIENVYMNTDLSVDEVVNLLSQLTYNEDGMYVVYVNADFSSGMLIQTNGAFYLVMGLDETFYFHNVADAEADLGFIGWNPNITYPITINIEGVSEANGLIVGTQNDLLSSLISTTPFSDDMIDLVPYIENKRLPLKLKVIGGAKITYKETKGTTVDTSTTTVYFNNTMSAEKTEELLSQLPYETDTFGTSYTVYYNGYSNSTVLDNYGIYVFKEADNSYLVCDFIYALYNGGKWDANHIFYTSNAIDSIDFIGWNPNLNKISFSVSTVQCGSQNDLINAIISSTPFSNKTIKLNGTYDGSVYEKTQLDCISGTTIPNTGEVENIYLNTTLSTEEVINYIDSVVIKESYISEGIVGSSDGSKNLCITKWGIYCIGSFIYEGSTMKFDEIYFYYAPSGSTDITGVAPTFEGWNPDFNGVLEFNITASNELTFSDDSSSSSTISNVGQYNDKLTKLFSLTPFETQNSQVLEVDLTPLIQNKQHIPTSVKFNVQKPANVEGDWAGGEPIISEEVSYPETVFYFNSEMSTFRINNLLSQLTYEDYLGNSTQTYGILAFGDETANDGNMILYVQKFDDGYTIAFYNSTNSYQKYYYNSSATNKATTGFTGWDLTYFDTFGKYGKLTYQGKTVGQQNELLNTLMSWGDFTQDKLDLIGTYDGSSVEVTENQTLDIKSMIENEKRIPLKVNVNVASSGGGESTLKKLLDYTKTMYYMFYQNTTITDLTDYIAYSDTENVTNMKNMCNGSTLLETFPNVDTRNVTTTDHAFSYCKALTSVPIFDMLNTTNANAMFSYCESLPSLILVNTNKIEDSGYMFQSCKSLETISDLDLNSSKNYNGMFTDCHKLKKIKLIMNSGPFSSSISFQTVFKNCYLLEQIDLSYYGILSSNKSNNTYQNCYSLRALIIRQFGTSHIIGTTTFTNCYHLAGTVDATYNPNGDKDCYIYVPSAMVDTLKSATNWSTYADQIRALEDYTVDGTTTGELDESKVNA